MQDFGFWDRSTVKCLRGHIMSGERDAVPVCDHIFNGLLRHARLATGNDRIPRAEIGRCDVA